MNLNINILNNKVILINIAIVTIVIIAIIILNTPTTIDYEELITIPNNYTPRPFVEGTPVQIPIKVTYPDEFIVQYSIYTVSDTATAGVITTEYQPYPMSPASSILICDDIQPDDTVLVLAITKTDTTPAVYAVVLDDVIRCYFSDPFPTGYNSIVVFIKVDTNVDNLRVEIRKIRELN